MSEPINCERCGSRIRMVATEAKENELRGERDTILSYSPICDCYVHDGESEFPDFWMSQNDE